MITRRGLREIGPLNRNVRVQGSVSSSAVSEQDQTYEVLLSEIKKHISENRDQPLSLVLNGVVDRVRSLAHADGAAIAVLDEWGVVCRASAGSAPSIGSRLRADSGLSRECFDGARVVICEDAESDPRIQPSIAKSLRVRSLVAVPLVRNGAVLGLVEVLSSRARAFDSNVIARISSTAELLAPFLPPSGRLEEEPATTWRWWVLVASAVLALLLLLALTGKMYRRWEKVSQRTPPHISDSREVREPPASRATGETSATGKRSEARSGAPLPSHGPSFAQPVEAEKSASADSNRRSSVADANRLPSIIVPPNARSPYAPPAKTPAPEPPPVSELTTVSTLGLPLLTAPALIPIRPSVAHFALDRSIRAHAGWITSVAFSPDGRRLVSGGWDQAVKLWEVPTAHELSTVGTKLKEIQALALSRDGRWLAAENSSDTVTLWDATSGQEIRKLASNKPLGILGSSWIYSIAFSPDSHWLASGVDDKTVRLWDVETGRPVRDLTGSRRSIIYAAFSPDGRWLASGSDEKSIGIWNVSTGQQVRTLNGHKKAVYTVAFSPNGRWLASAGADKTIRLWDNENGKELHTLTGHQDVVTSVAFSADGRWLASGSWDKTIKIWDVQTGSNLQTLNGHSHNIYTVAFEPAGQWLASGSEDGTIKLWRLGKATR